MKNKELRIIWFFIVFKFPSLVLRTLLYSYKLQSIRIRYFLFVSGIGLGLRKSQ